MMDENSEMFTRSPYEDGKKVTKASQGTLPQISADSVESNQKSCAFYQNSEDESMIIDESNSMHHHSRIAEDDQGSKDLDKAVYMDQVMIDEGSHMRKHI